MQGSHSVSFTVSDILALVLAFLGFVGTTGMLVMNLKVTTAVQAQKADFEKQFTKLELQIERGRLEASQEHSAVKLNIAELRTRIAEESNTQLSRMMRDIQNTFMNRQLSEQMHAQNTQRLDALGERLKQIEEKVNL